MTTILKDKNEIVIKNYITKIDNMLDIFKGSFKNLKNI
jgi:hypothetical protein